MTWSNMPLGVNEGPSAWDVAKCTCKKCGRTWMAEIYYELGGWFFTNDNDAACPNCGQEVELETL